MVMELRQTLKRIDRTQPAANHAVSTAVDKVGFLWL